MTNLIKFDIIRYKREYIVIISISIKEVSIMINKLRVALMFIGFMMIAGIIGDMDVTNTMTSVHMAYIGIGLVLFIQGIEVAKKEF